MKKSVYSLVLSDDVIAAVDKAAMIAGMSRSAYINGVLAEAVSYVTPEKRMSDIFSAVERLMDDSVFRIMPKPSDNSLAIRSALQYRYKPVIRYSIELYRGFENTLGKLKVSFRTQSAALMSDFGDFLQLWAAIEKNHIIEHFPDGITYTFDGDKFTRTFYLPPDKHKLSDDAIAAALSEYVKMFDEIMKLYFANLDNVKKAETLVWQRYEEYLNAGMTII